MLTRVNNVEIAKLAVAVPKDKFSLFEYTKNILTEQRAKRMARGTGFQGLRILRGDKTTSDLCSAAAIKLLINERLDDIGGVVFVSQTPDYALPATSHILQDKLGLPHGIICMDINQGCSGYIEGLYISLVIGTKFKEKSFVACG